MATKNRLRQRMKGKRHALGNPWTGEPFALRSQAERVREKFLRAKVPHIMVYMDMGSQKLRFSHGGTARQIAALIWQIIQRADGVGDALADMLEETAKTKGGPAQ